MKNSQFNNSKRGASIGMFYLYTFLVFILLSMLCSCSSPELEKINVDPELYPTEKCFLNYQSDGQIIIIDKNHSKNDTIFKSLNSVNKEINLIIRGYYQIEVKNSTNIYLSITNSKKEVAKFNGRTNGLIYQFFNK
jgi:hypothetical protein